MAEILLHGLCVVFEAVGLSVRSPRGLRLWAATALGICGGAVAFLLLAPHPATWWGVIGCGLLGPALGIVWALRWTGR